MIFVFIIFLFGFGLPIAVLGMAFLFRRWSAVHRRTVALIFYVLGTIGLGTFCLSVLPKSGGALAVGIFLTFWLFASYLGVREWRKLNHKMARNPAVAREPLKTQPFFWEGMLILVPVVIMGLLAAAAVIKDRAAAEQEMRQRAENLLEQINRDFVTRFDKHRFNYEVTRDAEVWKLESQLFPPGDIFRSPQNSNSIADEWRADVPSSLISESPLLFCPAFNADGSMRPRWLSDPLQSMRPGNEPPTPPAWPAKLTPEQSAAWQSLGREMTESNNLAAVKKAVENLRKTKPGEDVIQNAEFFEERAALDAHPTAEAAQAMFQTRTAESETGIPITSLGLAEALKRADLFPDPGAAQKVWDWVVADARNKPNLLTTKLIELAEPLTRRAPQLKDCLPALKIYWSQLEDMWAVGELIQQSGKLRAATTTNFWLEFKGERWFCVLQPEEDRWDEGHGKINTNTYTKSRLLSLAAVTWAFTRAFEEARVTIPPYFALTGELADSQPIRLSPTTAKTPEAGSVLAQVEGSEGYLGNAKYILRIQVADAGLMLAAQRQRAMVIGALLAVSALAAFIGFFSARRAFYRQLRLNEMKSNFVSSVSHELRAPIASVRLMAEGLERGKITGAEKQNEYFKFIVQECRRLSSLIENVLDFSRIEQGRKQYEMEATDLVALTNQTVKLMETYAAERQVKIALEVKGDAMPVDIEGKAMQQALVNLIDNAVKHSPKGSEIMVGIDFMSKGARVVQIWVEDKGEGIPAVEHGRIFERFYRLGSELRRETQGVGIGLSIVKHIVEAHDGKIIVRSAPGEGSRFTIELPINQKKGET